MSFDERACEPSFIEAAGDLAVEPTAGEDRSIAPADPSGTELLDDLKARIAELDAIAWNLPSRTLLFLPPDTAWPADEESRTRPVAI